MGSGKDANWLKKQVQKLTEAGKFDDARETVTEYQNLPKVNVNLLRLRINFAENEYLLDELGITI